MIRNTLALYASRLLCLCLATLLTACVNTHAPYQSLSDAKQALTSAQTATANNKSPQDISDLTLAEGILRDGESALNAGKFAMATTLFNTSKKHSQAILRRRQTSVTTGGDVKFRY